MWGRPVAPGMSTTDLLDHLVGAGEQCRRHVEAERNLGGCPGFQVGGRRAAFASRSPRATLSLATLPSPARAFPLPTRSRKCAARHLVSPAHRRASCVKI